MEEIAALMIMVFFFVMSITIIITVNNGSQYSNQRDRENIERESVPLLYSKDSDEEIVNIEEIILERPVKKRVHRIDDNYMNSLV